MRLSQLLRVREIGIFVAAVAIFALLALMRPNTFLTEFNLLNLVRSLALVGIVAVGMTYLFISAEIDLSVGSGFAFLSVVTAYLIVRQGWDWPVAAVAAVGLGALIGLFNGIVTTVFRIPSFIVTLGMLSVLRGLALMVSGGNTISGIKAPAFQTLTSGELFGLVPAQIVWLLGDDDDRRLGARQDPLWLPRLRHWRQCGGRGQRGHQHPAREGRLLRPHRRIDRARWRDRHRLAPERQPDHRQAFELDVIAAVVIGGTNLFGGSGSILGTFLGAAIAGEIRSGLVLLGAASRRFRLLRGQSSSWLSCWT